MIPDKYDLNPILTKPETEEAFLNLCSQVREWLLDTQPETPNIFFAYFLIQKRVKNDWLKEACEKYASVKSAIDEIRKIEKWKVLDLGAKNKLKSDIVKLYLVNEHGYKDATRGPGTKGADKGGKLGGKLADSDLDAQLRQYKDLMSEK